MKKKKNLTLLSWLRNKCPPFVDLVSRCFQAKGEGYPQHVQVYTRIINPAKTRIKNISLEKVYPTEECIAPVAMLDLPSALPTHAPLDFPPIELEWCSKLNSSSKIASEKLI